MHPTRADSGVRYSDKLPNIRQSSHLPVLRSRNAEARGRNDKARRGNPRGSRGGGTTRRIYKLSCMQFDDRGQGTSDRKTTRSDLRTRTQTAERKNMNVRRVEAASFHKVEHPGCANRVSCRGPGGTPMHGRKQWELASHRDISVLPQIGPCLSPSQAAGQTVGVL